MIPAAHIVSVQNHTPKHVFPLGSIVVYDPPPIQLAHSIFFWPYSICQLYKLPSSLLLFSASTTNHSIPFPIRQSVTSTLFLLSLTSTVLVKSAVFSMPEYTGNG